MSVTKLLAISLGAILTNNFIFSQFLGICPFLGVSKKSDTAVGMGLAVTFVMGLASAFCYGVNIILVKLGLGYMQTVAFILVVASLVQFIEMFLKKSMPTLYTALGVYLPLITTNCAVLGVVLLILSAFRELFGAGTLLGVQIMPSSYVPAGMLTLPVGGFLCLGTLIAIMQWALARSEKKNAEKKETEGK